MKKSKGIVAVNLSVLRVLCGSFSVRKVSDVWKNKDKRNRDCHSRGLSPHFGASPSAYPDGALNSERLAPLSVSVLSVMQKKIIIGAGNQKWDGWIATQGDELNLLDEGSWERYFGSEQADAFLCEHVYEHLTFEEGKLAARIISRFLKPGGFIRVAVPDRHFPDPEYQRGVQVGGPGPADHPAADHKIVYGYRELTEVFESAGFEVRLLEYHDEDGRFQLNDWNPDVAPVYRSSKLDHRNQDGVIRFASLIIDAKKKA